MFSSKKSILVFSFLLCFALITCNDNDDVDRGEFVSCNDGIQNGGEDGIDCGGPCSRICSSSNTLEGEILSVLDLNENEEYTLTGPLLIRDAGQLIIRAGVVIKAMKDSNAYIAVAQGGSIFVYGTEDNPVVFTSNEENPQPGDWGGLLIFGKAPTNSNDVDRSDLLDIFYGGNESDDSSGQIRYLRIEYAGAVYEDELKFNGFSLYGVGRFTGINHVQTYKTLGNGFKIIGGTVNPEKLVSSESGGSGIILSDGWNGVSNSWFVNSSANFSLEILNRKEDPSRTPLTTGELFDISLLTPSPLGAINYAYGGGNFTLSNVYTFGQNLGVNVTGNEAISIVDNGGFNINPIEFDATSTEFVPTNYTGPAFYLEGANSGAGDKSEVPQWARSWAIGF